MFLSEWSVWELQVVQFVQHTIGGADAAHDFAHIKRVVANATALALVERADLAVVLPAAWLHDCVNVAKDSPLRASASTLAARAAREFLVSIAYPDAYLPAIEHAIEAHSFSANIAPRTREAEVVQDADRLDALGAIGIARFLMLGGATGKTLYHPDEPLPHDRQPNDNLYVIDHFYRKLLRLADGMTTAAGRTEAQQRTVVMRQFLAQLETEITRQ